MPVNDVKRCEWCGNNAEEFVVFHGEKMCVDCRDAELKEAESERLGEEVFKELRERGLLP